MAHKRIGQISVTGEWAQHLRPRLRRRFWKKERGAQKTAIRAQAAELAAAPLRHDSVLG
ncbi:MAG: hypothetical protein IT518_18900 [Burkholderiales bacterium]|nr:hypothetical protein [Burkholderiales bacterium]